MTAVTTATAASAATFRPCVLIPTYDNPATIAQVVATARQLLPEVVVVDDGSGPQARAQVAGLRDAGLAHVLLRERNGGKGAAVKSGFAFARELGYTHALQVDADGQHDLARIPAFLEAAAAHPDALVLGYPRYDAEAPRGRLVARRITQFWVHVQTGGRRITDPMIGFRVYPLAATTEVLAAAPCGDRMDFDIEIAVRLAWARLPIINLPVAVRYLAADEGGVSHFRLVRDNVRISWLHTRLTTLAALRGLAAGLRWLGRAARRLLGRGPTRSAR